MSAAVERAVRTARIPIPATRTDAQVPITDVLARFLDPTTHLRSGAATGAGCGKFKGNGCNRWDAHWRKASNPLLPSSRRGGSFGWLGGKLNRQEERDDDAPENQALDSQLRHDAVSFLPKVGRRILSLSLVKRLLSLRQRLAPRGGMAVRCGSASEASRQARRAYLCAIRKEPVRPCLHGLASAAESFLGGVRKGKLTPLRGAPIGSSTRAAEMSRERAQGSSRLLGN